MKDNEILEIPIKGLLGQGLLKEIPGFETVAYIVRNIVPQGIVFDR